MCRFQFCGRASAGAAGVGAGGAVGGVGAVGEVDGRVDGAPLVGSASGPGAAAYWAKPRSASKRPPASSTDTHHGPFVKLFIIKHWFMTNTTGLASRQFLFHASAVIS